MSDEAVETSGNGGVALVGVYMAGWVVVLVVVSVVMAVALLGNAFVHADNVEDGMAVLRDMSSPANLPPWVMVLTMMVQLPLMWALVPLSHAIVRRAVYDGDADWARPDGWRGVYGTYRARGVQWGLALAVGLCIGVFPGWIAQQLRDLRPEWATGSLEMIEGVLLSAPLGWRIVFAVQVALVAPLVEEVVFRGFMWDALKRVVPMWAVWLLTSAIFAAYHMDPVQSSAVLVTGLALGWMRWTSGSVWPPVVLHTANNSLAVAATVWAGDVASSLAVAVGALAVAVLLLWASARAGRAVES